MNLPQVDRVLIAGACPAWARDVIHVPVAQAGGRYESSTANLRSALGVCSERFVVMDDDFFVLEPTPQIPVMHRGSLAALARERRGTSYGTGMMQALGVLRRRGIADPVSYELHAPMILERAGVLEALEAAGTRALGHVRTLWGNVYGAGGAETGDVKLGMARRDISGWRFVSTSDRSFANGWPGALIRERFAEPSRYEA